MNGTNVNVGNGCTSSDETKKMLIVIMNRLEIIEKQLQSQKKFKNKTKPNFIDDIKLSYKRRMSTVLADNVGVVGLKETLTWKHRPLKTVWAFLLMAGAVATAFYIYQNTAKYFDDNTATKVSFKQLMEYPFPPFVACPPWPFRLSTALSTGISLDALKYSMDYLYEDEHLHFEDSKPVEQFKAYYSSHNFTSLADYLNQITAEAVDVSDEVGTVHNETLTYACEGCDSSVEQGKKRIFNQGICYIFNFTPAKQSASYSAPWLYLKNKNDTGGALHSKITGWMVDLLPNVGCTTPRMKVGPGIYTMKISVQSIKLLEGINCEKGQSTNDERDSRQLCLEKCLNITDPLYQTPDDIEEWDGTENRTVMEDKRVMDCEGRCKPLCNKSVYSMAIEYNLREEEMNRNGTSSVELTFEHTAWRQGYYMIYEEMDTMTFSDFVSNVGGTFGLFLGCTFLTIAQFILSLTGYFIEHKHKSGVDS